MMLKVLHPCLLLTIYECVANQFRRWTIGVLVFKQPLPSMARSVWGCHRRFMDVYYNVYPGYYFTGDGAARDSDGFYWIRGRVDDVVNVSLPATLAAFRPSS